MSKNKSSSRFVIIAAAMIATVFGGMTIYAGGSILFFDGEARAAAGNYVPFVLWFNFIMGFVYILASAGLFWWRGWGVRLSMLIALATLLVFAAFGVHILWGGEFEPRTIMAMTLRSLVWLIIAYLSRSIWKKQEG